MTSQAGNSSRLNALSTSAIDRNVTSDEFLPKHFSTFFTCLSVCISTWHKLQTTMAVQITGKHNTDESGYAYTESRQHIRHNGQFYVKRLIYKSCPFARQKDTSWHAKAGILKHERTHTAMRQYSSLKIKTDKRGLKRHGTKRISRRKGIKKGLR